MCFIFFKSQVNLFNKKDNILRLTNYVVTILVALILVSCDTMEEKKETSEQTPGNSPGNMDNPHNFSGNETGDADAERLMKEAMSSYESYKGNTSEETKEVAIKKNMEAAMYLMYDAQLPPKDKYKPALKHFRIVLKLDPNHEEAKVNMDKIVEIYEQMGKPVPETEI